MADNPDYPSGGVPDNAGEHYTMLANNGARANTHMKIDATKTDTTFTVDIFLDASGTPCYSETDISLESLGTVILQWHWGSGVVFTNIDISGK